MGLYFEVVTECCYSNTTVSKVEQEIIEIKISLEWILGESVKALQSLVICISCSAANVHGHIPKTNIVCCSHRCIHKV